MDLQLDGDIKTYYVFELGLELYALETEKIQDIKVGYEDQICSVTHNHCSVMGVMETEKETVPIIDLASKLEIKETKPQSQARTIIFIEAVLDQQKRKYGIRIDTLLGVINVKMRDLMETSLYEPDIKQFFVSNRFSDGREIIKILDAESLLTEVEQLSESSQNDHDTF